MNELRALAIIEGGLTRRWHASRLWGSRHLTQIDLHDHDWLLNGLFMWLMVREFDFLFGKQIAQVSSSKTNNKRLGLTFSIIIAKIEAVLGSRIAPISKN